MRPNAAPAKHAAQTHACLRNHRNLQGRHVGKIMSSTSLTSICLWSTTVHEEGHACIACGVKTSSCNMVQEAKALSDEPLPAPLTVWRNPTQYTADSIFLEKLVITKKINLVTLLHARAFGVDRNLHCLQDGRPLLARSSASRVIARGCVCVFY